MSYLSPSQSETLTMVEPIVTMPEPMVEILPPSADEISITDEPTPADKGRRTSIHKALLPGATVEEKNRGMTAATALFGGDPYREMCDEEADANAAIFIKLAEFHGINLGDENVAALFGYPSTVATRSRYTSASPSASAQEQEKKVETEEKVAVVAMAADDADELAASENVLGIKPIKNDYSLLVAQRECLTFLADAENYYTASANAVLHAGHELYRIRAFCKAKHPGTWGQWQKDKDLSRTTVYEAIELFIRAVKKWGSVEKAEEQLFRLGSKKAKQELGIYPVTQTLPTDIAVYRTRAAKACIEAHQAAKEKLHPVPVSNVRPAEQTTTIEQPIRGATPVIGGDKPHAPVSMPPAPISEIEVAEETTVPETDKVEVAAVAAEENQNQFAEIVSVFADALEKIKADPTLVEEWDTQAREDLFARLANLKPLISDVMPILWSTPISASAI